MYLFLLVSALLVGGLLAVQAAANLQLTAAVGTPYGASTVQLGLAASLLAILAVVAGAAGAVKLLPEVPAWQLLGGLASPLYITSGILLFPRLGALAAVGLFVTGQMFASVGLDLFGLLGIERKPLSAGLVLGALAVLSGITVMIRVHHPTKAGSDGTPRAAAATRRIVWILLGIAAGAALPVQGAVNARLRQGLDEPLAVATISFAVATLTIAVVLLLLLGLRRTSSPRVRPLREMPWWGWLGAACAAAYVTATFLLMPAIGAATTVALTVTGQQLASAAIDARGLLRLPRRPLTGPRAAGLALLVAGSALVQLS